MILYISFYHCRSLTFLLWLLLKYIRFVLPLPPYSFKSNFFSLISTTFFGHLSCNIFFTHHYPLLPSSSHTKNTHSSLYSSSHFIYLILFPSLPWVWLSFFLHLTITDPFSLISLPRLTLLSHYPQLFFFLLLLFLSSLIAYVYMYSDIPTSSTLLLS